MVSQRLNFAPVDTTRLIVYMGVAIAAYLGVTALYRSADTAAQKATEGAGQALSDLTAALNGWSPVELVPLMIRDFYLNDDYTLTADARETLWKISDYQPLLIEIFGNRYAPMKAQYRSLINVEITKEML